MKGAPLFNNVFNSSESPLAAAFNNCLPNSCRDIPIEAGGGSGESVLFERVEN